MADLAVRLQYLVLLIGVLCCLPFSIPALICNYAYLILSPQNKIRRRIRNNRVFTPKTILITGADTLAGLRVARAFYQSGHNVIGVRSGHAIILAPAYLSKAFTKWHDLCFSQAGDETLSYANELVRVVRKEKVDLLISCAHSNSVDADVQAKAIVEKKTSCVCLLPNVEQAESITNVQLLLKHARDLGMPVPETHQVKSRSDIHNVLNGSRGKRRYTLKSPDNTAATWPRAALLPRRTLSQTYQDVARLEISSSTPWLLKQYIDGLDRYEVLCVVVHNKIQAFAACSAGSNSSAGGRSLSALSPSAPIHGALLRLTQTLVKRIDSDLSTHLTLHFCVDQQLTDSGLETTVMLLSGDICVDEKLTLFQNLHGSIELSRAYLQALDSPPAEKDGWENRLALKSPQEDARMIAMPVSDHRGVYSFGVNVAYLLLHSTQQLLRRKIGLNMFWSQLVRFVRHIIWDKDNIYESWDPIPFWWSYQVSLPLWLALASLLGLKQTRPWAGLHLNS